MYTDPKQPPNFHQLNLNSHYCSEIELMSKSFSFVKLYTVPRLNCCPNFFSVSNVCDSWTWSEAPSFGGLRISQRLLRIKCSEAEMLSVKITLLI